MKSKDVKAQELTEKQKRFANEYLKDLNGTQAAIRSGYSKKTAKEQASRLLTNANISEFIEKRRATLEKKTEITQEWVLAEIKTQYQKASHVAEFTPAIKALELLGKTFGMFKDKLEHSGGLKISHEDALKELE